LPLVLAKTYCPISISDESKSHKELTSCFCRDFKTSDHIERIHLKGVDPEKRVECRYPVRKSQELAVKHLQHFKS